MHVLVTGAAGFIGSHACEGLLAAGHRVTGIDNLNDYYSPERKLSNLQEVRANSAHSDQFNPLVGDVRDGALVSELFYDNQFDAVVHLAAMAGVANSVKHPTLYLDVNMMGTLNLLEACRERQVPNFVLASTSSAYGCTRQIPFREDDPCDRPLTPYSASKRAAEMLAYSYHQLHRQSATVLRFFTVYGPRGRQDMMAYKVLDNIFFGREVPIYDGGQMHRDWTYVSDIVAGIVKAAERPLGYEIINLGRGEPVLLADFVRTVEKVAGRPASLHSRPRLACDIPYSFACVDKARKLLDYQPRVSVPEGVRRFFDWYDRAVLTGPAARPLAAAAAATG